MNRSPIRLLLAALLTITLGSAQEEKVVLIPVDREKPVPLFFSAQTETNIIAGIDRVDTTITATLRVHQGRPEVMSLGLTGVGEVASVTGDGLKTWTVRREADGTRFLDLKPELPPDPKAETLREFRVTITAGHDDTAEAIELLLPAPGAAVGFSSSVTLSGDGTTAPRVIAVDGLQSLLGDAGTQRFSGSTAARLQVKVELKGTAARPVELADAALDGRLSDDGGSLSFTLRGQVEVNRAGEAVELLEGVALSGATSGEGWFVRLKPVGDGYVYELVGEAEGRHALELAFEVPLTRQGDWRALDFKLRGGAVVPLRLAGLEESVSFKPDAAVVPERREGTWTGYLPATGAASLAWKSGREESDGALFFSSSEIAEVRVGAGLARRYSRLGFRVLQGKLESLKIRIDGSGEILAVRGGLVLAWSVAEEDGARLLDVRLSRPIEGSGEIEIEAQAALGVFPAQVAPPRFSPLGALRHSGYLRVANDGAVRLEVAAKSGLMQLSPAQFPLAKPEENLRQAFVYRFPSAAYDYEIAADQVLPEVGVNEVTVHELGETDRRITADLELDIREAPLREWSVAVPADFAVAAVEGAAVADFHLASEAVDGVRELKVLFNGSVSGRQLVTVRLEKNLAAAAGNWALPVLGHPGAKSSRGYIGVVVTAGYRAVPGSLKGLAETPVDYFPKKLPGLQQAFRIREVDWAATMKVEALGQSIQADVFHLYSVKEGEVAGSVLVNYFVVGAPASQWRIRVPETLGKVEVTGQNVGRDWRQEGDVLIIPLARPLLGAGTVLVTFDQPMSARGGTLSPGEVRPLDVQSERGHIQVVSPLQVNTKDVVVEGSVLTLDPSELPTEYRLLSSAPTLKAWQYTAGDVSIRMGIDWYDPGRTEDQVVDFAKLSSHVSRDGQVVTDARFFVKSRGRAELELSLKHGELWDSQVDGQPVNARKDGGRFLIPLPAKADPNEPVEVVLRYGVKSSSARAPELVAPEIGAPMVIGEWTVRGDDGRRIYAKGGVRPERPVLTESGLEWIAARARVAALVVLLAALAGWLMQQVRVLRVPGVLVMLGAGAGSLALAWRALIERRMNLGTLEFVAPVVPANDALALEIANVPAWQAMLSVPGILMILLGAVLLIGIRTLAPSLARGNAPAGGKRRYEILGGIALIAFGLLLQRLGAVAFFGLLGAALLFGQGLPGIAGLLRRSAPVAATALLFLASSGADGAERVPAESMIQQWRIQDGRLSGELTVEARGPVDARVLLLTAPAVLTEFTGDGWKVVKAAHGEQDAYFLVATAEGKKTGRATFEMPLPSPQEGWKLPSGPAAVQRVELSWNQPGWEFVASGSARVTPRAVEGGSGAELVLTPSANIVFQARPMQRDAAAEETRYFVETHDLYLPGPGVVSGRHRIEVRPSRGVVKELTVVIPEGFTVGDVAEGPVGSWRFNPETRELKVAVEPAQEQAFAFAIGTQRGTAALPADLVLEPVKVPAAAGAVGLLGLGFGDEAQAEAVNAKGMSAVNLDDFGGALVPRDREGRALAVMHRAYRHTGGDATLALKVTAVAPEVRATTRQVLSLGDDRLVMAADLTAAITRSGVFKLEVEIPAGFEVESVTGAALAHWAEATVDGTRLLHLHLSGRTLGEQAFAITLAAPFPGAQASWQVPRVLLRGATRQTGTLTVVPERGLQVRAVNRANVSQLDPREAGMPRPGALAFTLLQADWSLALAIAKLDPWVTAQVLHEVTFREGQTLSRVRLAYRIENAAMKALRVRIPGIDEKAAATVRASGTAVADFVPVADEQNLWEIRFQRGLSGETAVDIEFQQSSDTAAEVLPVELAEVRQTSYFVTLRTAGRIAIEDGAPLPRGWQRGDWAMVPAALAAGGSSQPPAFVYRAAEVEGPLAVALKRHELEKARSLRVESGGLTTLVSPRGASLTAVDLQVRVTEKGTMELTLPEGARLYNVLVNEDGVPLVQDGGKWLFHVHPAPEGDRPASVRFVYAMQAGGLVLEAPRLNVPLENLSWRVVLPEGWKLAGHGGDLELERQTAAVMTQDYRSFISSRRAVGKEEAVALLDQANAWMQAGEQDKAGQALSKAARNGLLDQASNEDARVQLRNLKAQQATLALNTRRQRLYLDNRGELSTANVQLEKAAEENPLLQGRTNFDPQQFDRLLEGNSVEENTAMKAIANRIVSQQLAADPAPAALDVTMAERGTVLTFRRSVQVDGQQEMKLRLEIEPEQPRGWAFGAILCALAAAVLGTLWRVRA
jgi:hypothetical protein